MKEQDARLKLIETLEPKQRPVLADLLRPAAEPVALIGMACRFPGGVNTPEEFWEFLLAGRNGIVQIPSDRWDVDAFYDPDPAAPGKMHTRYGGFLRDVFSFDAGFFGLSPREAVRLDPQHRLLLEVTWEALENAGQAVDQLAGSSTGVFVGIWDSRYIESQLMNSTDSVNDPHLFIGSYCSAAAGRLSYLLDLQGPSIAVDTACSSSLVAVHLACQSLRNKECDLALAGGVHALTSPELLVNLCKMRMLSADGQCKTLDARADGFGFSEGCGVVVLKRLKEALINNDPILAIIRGSAVNEDGRGRGSLTAPNGLAQQALIRRALLDAQLQPNDVSYVELHGTGTALGDTIEVEALQKTLTEGRSPEQPLLIGSAKTNLGHLLTAAGIAGLIKTVLCVQNGVLPPHLHLEKRNPKIDWNEGHLQVPIRSTPWNPVQGRRLAGINSFGWAGTNAHVIIEESNAQLGDPDTRPWQLLLISAQTDQALDRAAHNLAKHLAKHPAINLADVAYSLQVGRAQFRQRQMIICRNLNEAINLLENPEPPNVLRGVADSGYKISRRSGSSLGKKGVVFMFPGLGDESANVAAQIYRNEPTFREHFDQCCDLLSPHLEVDLRDLLGPKSASALAEDAGAPVLKAGQILNRDAAAGKPPRKTSIAQPMLFSLEYALAQLWRSWGIQPEAVIGYSLGEYVAACLAGMLSLEDALGLVSRRASLVETFSDEGAMLAIALPEQELVSWLPDVVDVSAIGGPLMCVVSGPLIEMQKIAERLGEEGVACRFVQTSHALHSRWMEPVLRPFKELLKTIVFHSPQIPFISTVTGTWITSEQATSPDYWTAHLRQPVRFSDGIQTLWQASKSILLEVGIGQTLGSLALQHPAREQAAHPLVLPSLPTGHDKQSEMALLLRSLGQLWLNGVSVDWKQTYGGKQRKRCLLPTYPFDHSQDWATASSRVPRANIIGSASVDTKSSSDGKKKDLTDWFYIPTWQRRPRLTSNHQPTHTVWLLFIDGAGLGKAISAELQKSAANVIAVARGEAFQRMGENFYTIHPQRRDDYLALMKHLSAVNQDPDHVVHLWSVTPGAVPSVGEKSVRQALENGFYSLLYLAQALGQKPIAKTVHISVISSNMQDVLGTEVTCPEKATLLGPCLVIPHEYSHITCTSIDIAWDPSTADAVVREISEELLSGDRPASLAYRGATRWIPLLDPVRLGDEQAELGRQRLRKNGVYMITGGFGGLGFAMAQYLAETFQARLVLVGRTPLPNREEWPAVLAGPGEPRIRDRIQQIRQLEDLGVEVWPASADVANELQMRSLVNEVHARFGKINGVFHAAGVPGGGLIQLKTTERVDSVLAPKMYGALVLQRALQDEGLDFMLLYSSVVVATGGLGEVDYCAANTFLDAFAHYQQHYSGIPTMAIDWGLWQWDAWQAPILKAHPEVYDQIKQLRQTYGITFAEGISLVNRVLGAALPQVMACPQSPSSAIAQWRSLSSFENLKDTRSSKTKYPRPPLHTSYVAPCDDSEQKIAELWAECLSIDKVGIHDHFMELGGNSLLAVVLVSRLQEAFQLRLATSVLYECPTVSALSEMFHTQHVGEAIWAEGQKRGMLRKELRRQQRHKQPPTIQ